MTQHSVDDVINTLSPGTSFGVGHMSAMKMMRNVSSAHFKDIAILEGTRRTASCYANGWVELFVISKSVRSSSS